ncbi:MAG TPA: pilus assembly protein TadG-related protein, partial [Candidatus Baltobacteraceae bacterium]|nr:pilus assembly protein TadG-related protein [Candidatus Baltobacteraceae bacterium]
MMNVRTRNRLHAQRGQTLVLVALAMLALMGVTALATDSAYYRYEQRLQQTAADAGAIAGLQELSNGRAAATAAAKADASSNGFTDGSNGVTVDVNTSYVDSFTGSSGGVQVQV